VEILIGRDHDFFHATLSRRRICARMRAATEPCNVFFALAERQDAAGQIFLTCTKNTELTAADFARRVSFAPT